MSLSRTRQLRVEADESLAVSSYAALMEEEAQYLQSQSERVTAANERAATAAARSAKVRDEIARLRDFQLTRTRVLSASEKDAYCLEWLRIMKEFAARKTILSFILAYSTADFKHADLTVVSQWLDTWGAFFPGADASVKELKKLERTKTGPELPPTQALYDALDDVCRLQLQARSLVGRERYRRAALTEEAEEDVMDGQSQLLEWCRKQEKTLENVHTLEELIAFSNSFHANVPVMDGNFLVLMDQSEAMADRVPVQEAMKEVNLEWVRLSLRTYEKLRQAASESHANSSLEALCTSWTQSAGPHSGAFLQRVSGFLKLRGKSSPEAQELYDRCEKLVREQEAHAIVCAHLGDFTIREDCVKPHFDALKKELQAPATIEVMSFPSVDQYEGKAEYKNRIEELREWIDVNSQKGTYMQLLERLEGTKRMIEEYADALFPDEEKK